MVNKNIQMKQKNGQSWDNLFPITLTENIYTNDGTTLDSEMERLEDSFNEIPSIDLGEIEDDLNETKFNIEQLEERFNQMLTINVEDFGAVGDGVTDDTTAIKNAIQFVHDRGGGYITFSDKVYIYSSDIELLENVSLKGTRNTILRAKGNEKCRLIPHIKTSVHDIKFNFPSNYNDSGLYLYDGILDRVNAQDPHTRDVEIFLERVIFNADLNYNLDRIGIELYADGSSVYNGFHGFVMNDSKVHGFNIGIQLHTQNQGWLNGNTFNNVKIYFAKTCVKIRKGVNSRGIDQNIFKLYVQAGEETEIVFDDPYGTNTYKDSQIWDMEFFPQAEFGTANLINQINNDYHPHFIYKPYLRGDTYSFIGTFTNLGSFVNHVRIRMTSHSDYDTVYHIRGGTTPTVDVTTYGTKRLNDIIKVYLVYKDDGKVEVYLYNTLTPYDVFFEASVSFESKRSFYPMPLTHYGTLPEDAVEMPMREFNKMETGSNSNGTWIKYADGTMECRHIIRNNDTGTSIALGNLFRTGSQVWEFPEPFSSTSDLVITVNNTRMNAWTDIVNSPTLTQAQYVGYSPIVDTTLGEIHLTAKGTYK